MDNFEAYTTVFPEEAHIPELKVDTASHAPGVPVHNPLTYRASKLSTSRVSPRHSFLFVDQEV